MPHLNGDWRQQTCNGQSICKHFVLSKSVSAKVQINNFSMIVSNIPADGR